MVIILLLIIVVYILRYDLKRIPQKDQFRVWGMFIVYIFAMIYYVSYINNQPFSFGYGIPGADMLAHFKGAEMLAKGADWLQLSAIATRFDNIGFGTIGYFLYTSFISLCIYGLPIFSIEINVYLVYVLQILVSLDTCLRFGFLVSSEYKSTKVISVFTMLSLCVPFMVQAFQLMRDVYYMWAMVSLLLAVSQSQGDDTIQERKSIIKTKYYLKIGLLLAMSFVLRFYSLVLTIPLMFYYSGRKKLALYVVLGEIGVLLLGLNMIDIIKHIVGLQWNITSPELEECVQFLLFPNIFNQSSYLWHWSQQFGTQIDISGCNVPGVYYAMSVWNVWILPLAIVGVLSQWKEKKEEIIIWMGILLSVVMIYSITYNTIDTRHKFFMSLPMCYLAFKGTESLKKILPMSIYNLGMSVVVIIILVMAY